MFEWFSSNSSGITSHKPRYLTFFYGNEFVCGGVASFVNVTLVYPFHKTVFFQQLNGTTWWESALKLHREGMANVYRGFLPSLLQRCATGSLMFGVQSKTEDFFVKYYEFNTVSYLSKKVISSIVAGCFEATLMPFERVQTILQMSKHANSYKNTFHAISSLVRLHGLTELYRGLSPVLCRNCFGNVLYFCGWDVLNNIRQKTSPSEHKTSPLWSFIVGGLLGACIGVACFPMNVAKAKMQSKVGGGFEHLHTTILELVHEKGRVSRLYRGVPANFVRSIISWGITTVTYRTLLELQYPV
ncbi:unnamed protein product [Protopolystoma xenopodis]|uniref:Mitochondrial carrier protein n=1 Tax=Protopolystoma xenopodis TaxID=117903 RepID=A0A448WUH8_9PLAT|nr:unnamed protein product [Protopolystoma xenopodis]